MKVKTLVLATAVIAMTTGGAFAQAGSGMSGGTGSTMSQPEAGSNKGPPTAKDSQKMEMQKEKSPGSTNSGITQEK